MPLKVHIVPSPNMGCYKEEFNMTWQWQLCWTVAHLIFMFLNNSSIKCPWFPCLYTWGAHKWHFSVTKCSVQAQSKGNHLASFLHILLQSIGFCIGIGTLHSDEVLLSFDLFKDQYLRIHQTSKSDIPVITLICFCFTLLERSCRYGRHLGLTGRADFLVAGKGLLLKITFANIVNS